MSTTTQYIAADLFPEEEKDNIVIEPTSSQKSGFTQYTAADLFPEETQENIQDLPTIKTDHASITEQIRPVARQNPDGSESTVIMAQADNFAFPTLFPKDPTNPSSDPSDWIELEGDAAFEEAKKRGEVFEFSSEEEAIAHAEGSWKENVPQEWMQPATEDTAGNKVHPTSDDIVNSSSFGLGLGASLANANPEELLESEIAKNVESKMSLPEQDMQPVPYQQALLSVEQQIYGVLETKPELILNNPLLSMYENPKQMAEGLIRSPIFNAPAIRRELGIQVPEYYTEPVAPEDKFLGRMYNAFEQSATMGYTTTRPSPAPKDNSEAIADVAGNFIGMLIPFSQSMKVGQVGVVATTSSIKKIKSLSKVIEQTAKQSPKAKRIAEGTLANIYGFNIHTQLGSGLVESSIIERIEAIPESTWHAVMFSTAGAMKEFGKLARLASYPTVGAIGYSLTPSPEDDPNYKSLSEEEKQQAMQIAQVQSIASGLMLMTFHRTSSGTRVEGMREYLDAFMPNISKSSKNKMILKSLETSAANPDFLKLSLNMYEGFKDFKPEPLITSEVPAPKVKVGKSHQMELFENIKELKEEIALDKVEKSKKEPTPKEEPAPKEVESQLDLDRDVPPEPGLKDGELGLAGEVVSIRRFYDKDNRIHIIQKLDKNENQIGEAEYAPNTKEAQLAVKELKKQFNIKKDKISKPVQKKIKPQQKEKPKIDRKESKRKIEALLDGVNEPSASYRYDKSIDNLKNDKSSYRYDALVELAKERGVYDSKNNNRESIVDALIDSYKNPEIKSQKPPKVIDGLKIAYDNQGKMKMDIYSYDEVVRVAKKVGVYDKKLSRLKLIDAIVRADADGKVVKDPLPIEKEAEYSLLKENIENMRNQIKKDLKEGQTSKSQSVQRKRASIRKAKELVDALENKYDLTGLDKTKVDIFPGISIIVDYFRAKKQYKDARKPLTDEEVDALYSFMSGKEMTDEKLAIAYTAMKEKPMTKSMGADGLKNVIQEIRKVFNPLADIPKEQRDAYLGYRYQFLGTQWNLTKRLEELVSGYKNYTENERVLSYLVLTGEADINSIKDPKLRRITKKTRRLFDVAGKGLVERGLLSEEAYNDLKGQYITRIYLRYMLDKGPQLGGRSKMSGVYNNVRKEMTPEMRARLGEIRTPELPITVGLTREFGDIAKYDFFKSLAEDGRFVFQPARAEVDGKMLSIGQMQHELTVYRQMLPRAEDSQKAYITEYIKKLESKLLEVSETMGQAPENFKQVPIHEGYGPLSGAYVNRAIHDDIVSMFQITEGSEYRNWRDNLIKAEKNVTAMWKTGKVAFNPPTVLRNVLSNPWQLSMSGMSYSDIPTTMFNAAYKMSTNHPDFINAGKSGVFGGTWSQAEIQSILKTMRAVEKEFETTNNINLAIKNGFGKVAGAYSRIDEFYKFVKYLDGKNKGLSDSEATIEAQKWVMDYSLVSPAVRELREHFFGVPFITYQAKILPLATEAAIKRPWTLLMPYLLTQMTTNHSLNKLDINEEEFGEMQVAMGTEMANSKALLVLPFKDSKGRVQVTNMEYGLPWEFWVEFGENAINGDITQLRNNMGVAPIFTAMAAAYTGTIPTQDGGYIELWNSQSTPAEKSEALMNFLWDMSLPSTFGPRGPIANLIEGTTQVGKPETTLGQDLSRFSAYTIKPITDEGYQRAVKIANAKLSALGKEYALKEKKLIKKSKMTGEVFVETEEYKELMRDKQIKITEIYKKHYGPLVIGRWKDGSLKTVESVMDSTQEELIEIFKKIEVKQ
tara:strand:+ start:4045 stop:9357 length:5313 start_codon:yes stop_codon:yes gene_type:complete